MCQKKGKDVDSKVPFEFFQKYFVVNEQSAVQNSFITYVWYAPDVLFWMVLYVIITSFLCAMIWNFENDSLSWTWKDIKKRVPFPISLHFVEIKKVFYCGWKVSTVVVAMAIGYTWFDFYGDIQTTRFQKSIVGRP